MADQIPESRPALADETVLAELSDAVMQASMDAGRERFEQARGGGSAIDTALDEAAEAARQESLRAGASPQAADAAAARAREALAEILFQVANPAEQTAVKADQSDFATQELLSDATLRQDGLLPLGGGDAPPPPSQADIPAPLGQRQVTQALGVDPGQASNAIKGEYVTQKLGVAGALFAPFGENLLNVAQRDAAALKQAGGDGIAQSLSVVGPGVVMVDPAVHQFRAEPGTTMFEQPGGANPTGAPLPGNPPTTPAAATPAAPTPAQVFVAGTASMLEGSDAGAGAVSFVVQRTTGTGASVVDWSLSGLSDDDFAAGGVPRGQVSFAEGETSKTVTVHLAADRRIEADETLTIRLDGATGTTTIQSGGASADQVVRNDDGMVWVEAAASHTGEKDTGETTQVVFVVRRSSGNGAGEVAWRADGLDPADFGGSLPSGVVRFADGETSRTIVLDVPGDLRMESAATIGVELGAASGGLTVDAANRRAETVFADNDRGAFSIAATAADQAEAGTGGTTTYTFTVSRSVGTDGPASIDYRVLPIGANAADAADFAGGVLPAGTVAFAAGETSKTITITVLGDAVAGADETFAVVLSNPPAGTAIAEGYAQATIRNDDSAFTLTALAADAAEGSGADTTHTFTVTRSGDLSRAATVDYAVRGGGEGAASGADFGGTLPHGSVTFAPGQSSATITVTVSGDGAVEGHEGYQLVLVNPSDNAQVLGSTALGTVRNDDSTVTIHAADAVRLEGHTAQGGEAHTFVITRGGSLDQPVTVTWSVRGSGANGVDAADFGGVLPGGTVTFAAGETSKTITVTPSGDQFYEQNEGYAVVIATTQPGVTVLNNAANGLVVNDEVGLAVVATDLVKAEGQSGVTLLTFTVTRSGVIQAGSSVDWALVPGAVNGVDAADFVGGVLPSGTLTFAPGEQSLVVTIPVVTDAVVEAAEGFTIHLSNPSVGSDILVNDAVGSIGNDDAVFAVAADTASVAEGQSGTTLVTFRVTRGGDAGGVASVAWAVTGSGGAAASGADFAGGSLPGGVVHFLAGETEKLVTIAVATDSVIEAAEQFTLTLSNPSAGTSIDPAAASAAVTVTNDDDRLSIAAVAADQAEGGTGAGAVLTFVVSRDGDLSTTSTVHWTIAGSGANAASAADFGVTGGIVTFAPGESSKTISVPVTGDHLDEADEGFTITLSNPSAGTTLDTAAAQGVIRNDDTGLSIAATSTGLAEGDSGGRTHVFTITRSGAVGGATSVDWTVSGVAGAGDFAVLSGTVTFAAGETSKTIELAALGDTDIEADESFAVTLSNADGGAVIRTASANGTIVSDDSGLAVAAVAATVAEGAAGASRTVQFTVTRSGASRDGASVDWTVSGDVDGGDFGGTLPSGTVTFAPGETSKTVTLVLSGDDAVEAAETVTVTLSNPSNAAIVTASASTTVVNDDVELALGAAPGVVAEGADGATTQMVVTVTRSGDTSGTTSAHWRLSGNGVGLNANDFAAGQDGLGDNGGLPSGTVTFAPGETTAQIVVTIRGDGAVETDEGFTVTLGDPGGNVAVTSGTVAGAIGNDDLGFSIAALDTAKAEGHSGLTAFTFTVTRAGDAASAAVVDYAVLGALAGNSADAADFGGVLPSGSLSFAAGEVEKILTVMVAADTVVEGAEGFRVHLSNARLGDGTAQNVVTAEATATIANDDIAYAITADQAAKAEGHSGQTAFTFTVTRSGDLSRAGTVDYAAGALGSGTVSFGVGETSKTVTIGVTGDRVVEADETLTVTLSNPSAGTIVGGSASSVVVNDDVAFAIAADAVSVVEGQSGTRAVTFTVTRTGDLSQAGSVAWSARTGGGLDAADFGGSVPSGTVTFAAGETSKTITVTIAADTVVEADETLTVVLDNPSQGTLTTASASTVIQGDDDSFAISAGAASVAEGHSGTRIVTFTITRDGPAHGAKSVDWAASGLSAGDFAGGTVPSGTLTFADGETSKTLTLAVAGDTAVEGDETLTVTLSNPSAGAVVATAAAGTTMVNDDAQLSISALVADKAEGNSGLVPFTFQVARNGFLGQSSTVAWQVAGGTVNAADFGGALPSGVITFAAGETSKTITVLVAADSDLENDESFQVVLSAPSSGSTIGTGTATGNIRNDDAQVGFTGSLSQSDGETDSGTTLYTYTVTRTGNTAQTSTVSVSVGGGLDSSEYVLSNDVITFAAGETSKTVTLSVKGDNLVEGTESFTLSLGATSGGTSVAGNASVSGTVLDDDVGITISGGIVTKAEGAAGTTTTYTYTITRSGSSREATFNLAWNGSDVAGATEDAAAANDFTGATVSRLGGGTDTLTFGNSNLLTFAEGETSKTVTITVAGDNIVENDEWFYLAADSVGQANSVDNASGVAWGEVARDESGVRNLGMVGTVGSTTRIYNIAEGDSAADGGTGMTTVTWWFDRQYGTAGETTVEWFVQGAWTDAADWVAGQDALGTNGGLPSGTVTFAPGQTNAYVTFQVATDDIGELSEHFNVVIQNPSGGSSLVGGYISNYATLINDDTTFTAVSTSVEEPTGGTANLRFTVVRDGDTRGTDQVTWSITFPGTEAGNEAVDTVAEWYKLDVSDVDIAGTVASNGGFTWNPTTRTLSGTLTFTDGQTQQTVDIPVLADSLPETWREGVDMVLSNPVNVDAGEARHDGETAATVDNVERGHVYDDDTNELITVTADRTVVHEGSGATGNTVTLTLTRSAVDGGSLNHPITVGWEVKDLNRFDGEDNAYRNDIATIGGDGVLTNSWLSDGHEIRYGTVTFAAGQTTKTITITFVGDSIIESDDAFSFSVLSPRDTTLWPWTSSEAGDSAAYGGENYGPAGVDPDNRPSTPNAADNPLTITLKNDDVRLWVTGAGDSPTVSVSEGDGGTRSIPVTLTRWGRTDNDVTITYTITNGSTVAGDWVSMTGTVVVPGGTANPTIHIPAIAGDRTIEPDETFTLTLSSSDASVNFGRGTQGFAPSMTIGGTLVNDDTTYAITSEVPSQAESDQGQTAVYTFTVTRDPQGYAGAATIQWRLTGQGGTPADAADFVGVDGLGDNGGLPSGTLTFAANEFTRTIIVTARGDIVAESTEAFQVTLSNASSGTIVTAAAAATIVTDDTGISIADAATVTEGDSGTRTMTFTVTRSGDLSAASSMRWGLAHGTTDAADFSGPLSGTVTFAAGETSKTVTVTVAGDAVSEGDESFQVTLDDFVNVDQVVRNAASGTIRNDDASFTITAAAADRMEGAGGHTFTITRDRSTAQSQTIVWQVTAADADAADFGGTLPSGSVTFAPGELTKTITVTPSNDGAAEGDEGYGVTIAAGAGVGAGAIGTGTATGTIRNDDAAVSVEQVTASQAEGHGAGTYTFTVRRTGNTQGSGSVDWALSHGTTNAADFSGPLSGTVTFADGEAVKTITVAVAGDSLVEADETFTVTLSNPTNAAILTGSATGTLGNDDASLSVAASDADKAEGAAGATAFTFTITRTGALDQGASVSWAVGSAQANGDDFVGGALPSGVAVFAPGSATATITVNVQGDIAAEGDEAFTVTLSNPPDGMTVATGTATGTIRADDVVFAVAPPANAMEGDGGTTGFGFVVSRSGDLSGSQTLTWTVAGIGADVAAAGDFAATTGTITFAAGETSKVITVPVVGDRVGEADEGFRLSLSGPAGVVFTNATADAVIIDDEASLRVQAVDAAKAEGGDGTTTTLTFRVVRSGNLGLAVSADWAVAHGTTDAADFVGALGGSVTFAAGETEKLITVTVQGDLTVEASERFSVVLSNPSAGADVVGGGAQGVIRSDDTGWTLSAVSATTQAEGDGVGGGGGVTFTYRVTRSGGLDAASVDWTVGGHGADAATAEDFGGVLPSGTLTFAAGETFKDITVTVAGDSVAEADQGFVISLGAPQGGGAHNVFDGSVISTIANDDDVMAITASALSGDEGDGGTQLRTFTVTRTGSLSGSSSVGWRIKAGGDTDAADFAATSGIVTFADGESTKVVTVAVRGDTVVEADEAFTVELVAPGSGSTIDATRAQASGSIADNDVDLAIGTAVTSVVENAGTRQVVFTVTRTGDLSGSTTAQWAVSGTVSAADFVAGQDGLGVHGGLPSGVVSFGPGESSRQIVVTVADDGLREVDETLTVTLSAPSGNAEVTGGTASVTLRDDDDTLSVVAVDADKAEGGAQGFSEHTFRIDRAGSADGAASVRWTVAGSGAHGLSADEFETTSGVVSFADGQTSALVTVRVRGDSAGEHDEGFRLVLSDASFGSTIVGASADGVVRNDDPALSITAVQAAKAEGDGNTVFEFTVTRSGNAAGVSSVAWAVRGSGANVADALDFGGILPSGTVSFADGETTKTIRVAVTGDTLGERDETFSVVLSSPVGADIVTDRAETTIVNDDTALSIVAVDADKAEGDGGAVTTYTFTVTRTGPADSASSVDWAVAGTGDFRADAADFAGGVLPSGSLVFAVGETSKTITVNVAGDGVAGQDEGFTVTLSNAANATVTTAAAAGTIRDDDSEVSVRAVSADTAEGDGGTVAMTFVVTRTGDLGRPASVGWRVAGSGESAADAADFAGGVLPSGTVTFAAGETSKTVTVLVAGDRLAENTEGFTLSLVDPGANVSINPAAGSAAGAIRADDVGVSILAVATGMAEGASAPHTFKIIRTGPLDKAVTVSYAVVGTGANPAAAADFISALTGSVVLAAGQDSALVSLRILNDALAEAGETYRVEITSSDASVLVGTAQGRIDDDDTGFSVSAATPSVAEGAAGALTTLTFDVVRAGATDTIQTIDWAVSGVGANGIDGRDLVGGVLPTGSLVFGIGESSRQITIQVAGDDVVEAAESLRVTIGAAAGITILRPSADVTIAADDQVGAGADTLWGGKAPDVLDGKGGDDLIHGGLGGDVLTGGAGADRFHYSAATEGGDTILDFARGQDRIAFDSAGFGGIGANGAPVDTVSQQAKATLAETLAGLAGQRDADFYRVDFAKGSFSFDGDLGALETAVTNGGHSGGAFFLVGDGSGTARLYYDADTSAGTDGHGLTEIAVLNDFGPAAATTANDDVIQVHHGV